MVDSLAMFFGAKSNKARKSPKRARKSPKRAVKKSPKRVVRKSVGVIVVRGRDRKLYKGVNGGLYYKTKSGKAYVDAKFVKSHSPKRSRKSPKRGRKSPKRVRMVNYGYGLGQPSLMNMMGPAGMSVMH